MADGTSPAASNPLASLGSGVKNALQAAEVVRILGDMKDPLAYAKHKPEDILHDLETLRAATGNPLVQEHVSKQLKALADKFHLPGADQAEAFAKQVQEVLKNETVQKMIKAVAEPMEKVVAAAIGNPAVRVGAEIAGTGIGNVLPQVQNALAGMNTMFNGGAAGGGGPGRGTGGPAGGTPD